MGDNDGKNGGGAPLPPRPKRPTIIRPGQRISTVETDTPQAVPSRPAPFKPGTRPPPPVITHNPDASKDTYISHAAINGSKGPSNSKIGENSKRKLEITIVDARPMSEMGFRGDKGSSPGLKADTPPASQPPPLPDKNFVSKTSSSACDPPGRPPRPDSISSLAPGQPPPRPASVASFQQNQESQSRPKRPTIIRPGAPTKQEQEVGEQKDSDPPARPARPSARPAQKTPFGVTRQNSGHSSDDGSSNPTTGPPVLTRPTVFRPQRSLRTKEESESAEPVLLSRPPSIPASSPAGSVAPPVPLSRPNANPRPRPRSRVFPPDAVMKPDPQSPGDFTPESDSTLTSSSSQELSPSGSNLQTSSGKNGAAHDSSDNKEQLYSKIKKTAEKPSPSLEPVSSSVFPVQLRSTVPAIDVLPNKPRSSSLIGTSALRNSSSEVKKPPPPIKPKPKPKPKPQPSTPHEPDQNSQSFVGQNDDGGPSDLRKPSSPKLPVKVSSVPQVGNSASLSSISKSDRNSPAEVEFKSKPTAHPTPETNKPKDEDKGKDTDPPPLQPKQISSSFLARFEQLSKNDNTSINTTTTTKVSPVPLRKRDKTSPSDPPVPMRRPITIIGGPRQNRSGSNNSSTDNTNERPVSLADCDAAAPPENRSPDLSEAPPPLPTKRPITIIGMRSIAGASKVVEPKEAEVKKEANEEEYDKLASDEVISKPGMDDLRIAPPPASRPPPPSSLPRGKVPSSDEVPSELQPKSASSSVQQPLSSAHVSNQPARPPSRPSQPPAPSRPPQPSSRLPPPEQQPQLLPSQEHKPSSSSFPDSSADLSHLEKQSQSSSHTPQSELPPALSRPPQSSSHLPLSEQGSLPQPARPPQPLSQPIHKQAQALPSDSERKVTSDFSASPHTSEKIDFQPKKELLAETEPVQHRKKPARPGAPPPRPLSFAAASSAPLAPAPAPDDRYALEGDTVVLIKQLDQQWMVGSVAGEEGMFPVAFVKVKVPLGAGKSALSNWQESLEAWPVSTDDQKTELSEKPDKLSGPRCRARFDFEGDEENELAIEEGDIIRLLERVGDEWLKGELGGHKGIFPAAFVEVIEDLPLEAVAETPIEDSKSLPTDSSTVVKAVFDFEGQEGELTFLAGDEIEVLHKINTDWLLGKFRGQTGQFPASFVSHVPENLTSPEQEAGKLASSQSHSGEPKSSINTEVTCRRTIEHKHEKTQSVETKVHRRAEPVKVEEKPKVQEVDTQFKAPGAHFKSREEVLCVVRAMHDYEDPPLGDLPFKEGDMIDVVEFIGEDWGRGRLDNREGLFPLSFVAELEEVPPSPEPEPEKKYGRVLHDFEAEGPDDLSIKEGDVIELEDIADTQGNWRWGRLDGKRGMFPVVFVEELGAGIQTVV
ncbi:Sh3 domain-containing protein 19-like [Plakobranchus ocellatus]|uniref:Sh3 domain-containing protein 19-like n=1 Tax=Plakobranchus ocellatus TaxID=259542 RepID=A0AAV4AUZ0_9GAST|nr:Sh3 domain-containing protein 19-like [Plakobranchus ocellatus]